ncbi:hypothetical protein [Niabella soli]|uniref:Uncharacterized protein n=1 Tax=Niabella soli DSM 19437 TaxID=929713 RepID=W0F3W5_9BACT|nr:hypothetical protein [Niabella soli]AHF17672.1 hypothetical protein NIASO_12065 [Niabella soli DSM 19437]
MNIALLLKKYAALIVGAGFLLLGLLTLAKLFNDLSRNAGVAMIVIGIATIIYYLFRKN